MKLSTPKTGFQGGIGGGELWGVMGSYGELWGVMGSYGELGEVRGSYGTVPEFPLEVFMAIRSERSLHGTR